MAQSESTKCRINRLTMAVNNMDAMVAFYSSVFDIHFSKKEMYGGELFAGKLFGIEILFCPAVIAGNTATQNRHQFDCVVPDIHAVINLATANGGKLIGDIVEDDASYSIGVYDPDNNSMVFTTLKTD